MKNLVVDNKTNSNWHYKKSAGRNFRAESKKHQRNENQNRKETSNRWREVTPYISRFPGESIGKANKKLTTK